MVSHEVSTPTPAHCAIGGSSRVVVLWVASTAVNLPHSALTYPLGEVIAVDRPGHTAFLGRCRG